MSIHWNTPLVIVDIVKKILKEKRILKSPNFGDWLKTLETLTVSDKDEIVKDYLDQGLLAIQDPMIEYHIMKLERLFSFEEDEELTAESFYGKINRIRTTQKFLDIKERYIVDYDKRKKLFVECIKNVSTMQEDNFLTLKYGRAVTFYALWNEFYMECRGTVIDVDKMRLVSTPYRKFFGLNEIELTKFSVIEPLLQKAKSISIKDKLDGSMISMSKYEGELFFATPGSSGSKQALWAKKFFVKKYGNITEQIPEHLTFIFEAIYPGNRIVIDYKDREDLPLTGIRNNLTGTMLEDNLVEEYAKKFGFSLAETEPRTFLEILNEVKDIEKHPATEKEGWVVTIRTEDETLMFKLKCDDYVAIHKILSLASSPKIVLCSMKEDKFDDLLSKVPPNFQGIILNISRIIMAHVDREMTIAEDLFKTIPKDLISTKEERDNYFAFNNLLSTEIVPNLKSRLSTTSVSNIRQGLINKSLKKQINADECEMKEIETAFEKIPEYLKDQSTFKKKKGQLWVYISKNIPSEYRSNVVALCEHKSLNILENLHVRDINFKPIQSILNNYED